MAFWNWRRKRRKDMRINLFVMRANEMLRVHPLTDWSHRCSKCNEPVGIYPSGQVVIEEQGTANVTIICNHCQPRSIIMGLAPGALDDVRESIKNPNL